MSNTEPTKDQPKDEAPDFERSLEELEKLVEALESGELSLNESLERFKRGIELSKHCHRMLDRARETVEILTTPEDEDSGQPF
ncbi:MAG TPA: exodeoxyribonuclease VII small subunit [Wenzhouxiangella sp.]|nr:exodeoxyribonuclease VII small subunit [Wenzhouxiangella sp.]